MEWPHFPICPWCGHQSDSARLVNGYWVWVCRAMCNQEVFVRAE